MESLRPERDELDHFKSRKKKSSGSPDSPKSKNVSKQQDKIKNKGNPFFVLLLVLLVAASSVLALAYVWQQEQLVSLKAELKDATSFIGQSKLLLARLEGELSETDAELEQSGSAAKSKLAFLDSEMRKLWGVSNDRNKKMIQSNAEAVAGLEQRIINLVSSQKKRNASSELVRNTLSNSIGLLEKEIGQLASRVSATASDAVIARVEQEEQFSSLRREVAEIPKLVADISALNLAVSENEKAIASIDASRRQLNGRIVELDRKLNVIQLQLNSAEKTAHVQ